MSVPYMNGAEEKTNKIKLKIELLYRNLFVPI